MGGLPRGELDDQWNAFGTPIRTILASSPCSPPLGHCQPSIRRPALERQLPSWHCTVIRSLVTTTGRWFSPGGVLHTHSLSRVPLMGRLVKGGAHMVVCDVVAHGKYCRVCTSVVHHVLLYYHHCIHTQKKKLILRLFLLSVRILPLVPIEFSSGFVAMMFPVGPPAAAPARVLLVCLFVCCARFRQRGRRQCIRVAARPVRPLASGMPRTSSFAPSPRSHAPAHDPSSHSVRPSPPCHRHHPPLLSVFALSSSAATSTLPRPCTHAFVRVSVSELFGGRGCCSIISVFRTLVP